MHEGINFVMYNIEAPFSLILCYYDDHKSK